MRRERLGLLFILISTIGYSFLPVFAHNLSEAGIPPIETVFWRYLITAPIFIGIALSSSRPAEGERVPRVGLFLLGFSLATEGLCAFVGFQYLSAGIYLALFYTYPAITAVAEVIMGERLSSIGWLSLGLTLFGVLLTIADFSLDTRSTVWIGVLCALVNAALASLYFIAMHRLQRGHSSPTRAGAYTVSGATVFLAGVMGVKGLMQGVIVPGTISVWGNLLGMVVICTVIPVLMINKGIREAGTTRAAIFGTMEPLLTAFWAQLILGQTLLPIQWLGGVLIVISVILIQMFGLERRPQPAAA